MKLNLLQRLMIVILLVWVLVPVSLAWAGPPLPPPPPAIPTPPPDADFDYVKVVPKATGPADQIEFGTPGKDKIVMYGATGNVLQYIEADA